VSATEVGYGAATVICQQHKLEEMLKALKTEEVANYSIVGSSKLGKTFFLQNLLRKILQESDISAIYFDCQVEEFGWQVILEALLRSVSARADVPDEVINQLRELWSARERRISTEEILSGISLFLSSIAESCSSLKIYWLLDHFQVAIQSGFDIQLGMILREKHANLGIITATRELLPKHIASFFKSKEKWLYLLEEKEARQLAMHLLRREEERDGLVDKILKQAGRHPYYIDTLCKYVEPAVSGGVRIVDKTIRRWYNDVFCNHFEELWGKLDNDIVAKAWLRELGLMEKPFEITRESMAPLKRLQKNGIIVVEKDRAWIPSMVVRRFIDEKMRRRPLPLWRRPFDEMVMMRIAYITFFVYCFFFSLNLTLFQWHLLVPLVVWIPAIIYWVYGLISRGVQV